MVGRAILCTGVVVLPGSILVDGQIQHAVVKGSVVLCPAAVKRIAVCPAVRRLKQAGCTLAEISQNICIGTRFVALVRIVILFGQHLPQYSQIKTVYGLIRQNIGIFRLCLCQRLRTQQILLQQYDVCRIHCLVQVHIARQDILLR